MAVRVLVPRLGEGVDELTVIKWMKNVGDSVAEMESLLEVETDKVVTEIPSPVSGIVLQIAVPENTSAQVGQVMAIIGNAGEHLDLETEHILSDMAETGVSLDDKHSRVEDVPGSPKTISIPPSRPGNPFLSPLVRKIAAENNIDLRHVHGTGLRGRITKQDVQDLLQHAKPGSISERKKQGANDRLVPLSSVRRQIADRMVQSKLSSPHVMTVMEVDMGRVIAHRQVNRATYAADGVNLTYTPYFIAAIVSGLMAVPIVNSSWTTEGILIHHEINIGMATSLGDEGLIVPVIRRADEMSLLDLAKKVNEMAVQARSHTLLPDQVRGGTFTLTNHGIGGSLFAMPIINQPQCGILGTGILQKRPVVITDEDGNDSIAIRSMVYLSFVFDHRILDGAAADKFLFVLKNSLEKWA